ncbi:MAG: cytochrome c oxidase subunit 3 [SAR324 cluster bacterium]|nr:cytochrome c oxidase subunit 3 [SAR324 cluster bacterium]MEC9360515.1 cytochrome c oxidase subunit 3 [SAR324 cluster bacterium]MED5240442.1 cytochrome c oxidase subunit 3 [SAR324 cluster bacterium]MED5515230.1 cytochrome c oxidase subunit 3 [SAR324 cluster bacterium]MEE2600172.1 cytochrome c oxidase subunit 3 [SAR324 cluster bacterium]
MSTHGPIATHRRATGIPTGRLAVWWLLASEIFIFGGLVACFLLFKLNGSPGFEDAALTSVTAGAINTFVLLTSSLSIVLAHAAIEKGDTVKSFRYIWYTIGGGLIFLGIKTYEYTGKIVDGHVITENLFWSFYYTMTGLHALHVIGGMVIMALISFDIRKGYNFQRVELIGIYWHFVDLVWIFLFPLLYIANF